MTAFEHSFWSTSEPDPQPAGPPHPAPDAAHDTLADELPVSHVHPFPYSGFAPTSPDEAEPDESAPDFAPAPHAGLELSEKLQRLLDAVDSLDDGGFQAPPLDAAVGAAPDELVLDAEAESSTLQPVEAGHDNLPQPADQAAPSLIIRYDAGVELRFSGQSAVFLERLLRVSADLDALAQALPEAGGGEPGIAEPPER